ncbi:MAG: type II toxin-antitoxin system YoeB family toxin [Deltaproteobacteria bacterium]|nr:type II toxin-antitoxin system YoeB family toxin [Deltaproteobacteria bacterium]
MSWSRRIDREHRLVYQVANDELVIIACRFPD